MKWKLKEKKKIKLKGRGEKTMHEKLIKCENKIKILSWKALLYFCME